MIFLFRTVSERMLWLPFDGRYGTRIRPWIVSSFTHQQGMSERERQKQTLLGLTEQLPEQSKKSLHPFSRLPEFKVQSSSTTNNFTVPTSLAFPSEELSVKLPLRFLADKAGIYATKITLACGDDVRDFDIEVHCITQNDNDRQTATLHMRTSVFTPVLQNIPIVSSNDRSHPFVMHRFLFPLL